MKGEGTNAFGDKPGSLFYLTNVDDYEAIKERLELIRDVVNKMAAVGTLVQSNQSPNKTTTLSVPHLYSTDMVDIFSPSMVDLFL